MRHGESSAARRRRAVRAGRRPRRPGAGAGRPRAGRARGRPPRRHRRTDRGHLRHHAAAHAADGGAAGCRGSASSRDRRARPARGVPRRVGGRRVPPPCDRPGSVGDRHVPRPGAGTSSPAPSPTTTSGAAFGAGIERIAGDPSRRGGRGGRAWRCDRPGDEHRRRVGRVRLHRLPTTHRSRTSSSRPSAGSCAASTTRRTSASGSAPPTSRRRPPASGPPASPSDASGPSLRCADGRRLGLATGACSCSAVPPRVRRAADKARSARLTLAAHRPTRRYSKMPPAQALRTAYNVVLAREPDPVGTADYLSASRVGPALARRARRVAAGLRGIRGRAALDAARPVDPRQSLPVHPVTPTADRILDLGGTHLGNDVGALVALGYPYRFSELVIIDLPSEDRHPLYQAQPCSDRGATRALGPVRYRYHSMTDLSATTTSRSTSSTAARPIEHVTEEEGDLVLKEVCARAAARAAISPLDTPNARATRAPAGGVHRSRPQGRVHPRPDHRQVPPARLRRRRRQGSQLRRHGVAPAGSRSRRRPATRACTTRSRTATSSPTSPRSGRPAARHGRHL